MEQKAFNAVSIVGRVECDSQPLDMPQYDPVNYILDKIDYGLISAERVNMHVHLTFLHFKKSYAGINFMSNLNRWKSCIFKE